MFRHRRMYACICAAIAANLLFAAASDAGRRRPQPTNPHEPVGFQTFASPQSNPIALSPDGVFAYVANTTSGTVSFVRTSTNNQFLQIEVGLDPVSVAVRPDGLEVWVANHVSDSVSVIDTDPQNASYTQVIETIQSVGSDGATLFDEPVGIAFASNSKAYVALSSRNQIAVVDATNYTVTGFLNVRAQEPRALAVRNGLLYVAAFESSNKTEMGFCSGAGGNNIPGHQCGMGLSQLGEFITNPNIPGANKGIIIDPDVPDRDLFVFDTATDTEVDVVESIGTLLYGIAVDASGRAFVSQTDARNRVNGNGKSGLNLIDLDNIMFENQVAAVTCSAGGCGSATVYDVEPSSPTPATALATPYGIALSADDSILLVTAAGSNRLATFDAANPGAGPLSVLSIGAIPRGLAFKSSGATGTAYVLNTLDNSVSVVTVGAGGSLTHVTDVAVGTDPTPDAVRLGRIAFNNAFASTSGTFSCASCHPDGNTDQLMWRIGGACSVSGEFGDCDGNDEPRSTMPVRGLKNTLPLHWDGTLGDPFGGGNGSVGVAGSGGTDCTLGDADGDHDCFVDLVEESLAGVMCDQTGSCPLGGTLLSAQERDDMATFLASVSYPPARSRRMDDAVSNGASLATITNPWDGATINTSALQGFSDFFTNVNGGGDPRTCADADGGCHALPLGTSTNSATLNGFDAPTMRGLNDRFLQFSLGPTNAEEILRLANDGIDLTPLGVPLVAVALEPALQWEPQQGYREETTLGAAFLAFEGVYGFRPPDIVQMVQEASTGYSGAQGRQLTLNSLTAGQPGTATMLAALEAADARGVVNLRAKGRRGGTNVTLSYRANSMWEDEFSLSLTSADLLAEAQVGTTIVTLTAALRENVGSDPQPLIGTVGSPGSGVVDDPPLPHTTGGGSNPSPFDVSSVSVSQTAVVFLNGQPATGATLTCNDGAANGFCNDGSVQIDLASKPGNGLHLIQVQNPSGLLSNELPWCVGNASGCTVDPN